MRLLSTFAALTLLSLSMPAGPVRRRRRPRFGARRDHDRLASPEWTRRVEWGLDRFREAGLTLPRWRSPFTTTNAAATATVACSDPDDPAEVHLCTPGASTRAARADHPARTGSRVGRAQLTTAERAAFLALRGLDAWATRESPPRAGCGARRRSRVLGPHGRATPIIRIHDAGPSQLLTAFDSSSADRHAGPPAEQTPDSMCSDHNRATFARSASQGRRSRRSSSSHCDHRASHNRDEIGAPRCLIHRPSARTPHGEGVPVRDRLAERVPRTGSDYGPAADH